MPSIKFNRLTLLGFDRDMERKRHQFDETFAGDLENPISPFPVLCFGLLFPDAID